MVSFSLKRRNCIAAARVILVTATCGTPVIQHATFEYNADGTEATITCEGGYELGNAAQNKLQCSTNNQWTATPLPVCNIKGKNLSRLISQCSK